MKHRYSSLLLTLTCLLGLANTPALGQVSLTSFGTYSQNFDTLPVSTAPNSFRDNNTLPGIYAQAVLTGYGYFPGLGSALPISGNDGGVNTTANYYSFGLPGSSDRALGGIATTFYTNSNTPLTGTGYVAIRFVNNTNAPIANLEVSYAMEQWYNSGKKDNAQVGFDYQLPTSAFTGAMESGTWTSVADLGVAAPSTATLVASKNGNAPSNRRVLAATLFGLNLAVGKEVVLRWKYVLNKDTNGNGLAIDDVTVTPEAGTLTSNKNDSPGVFNYSSGPVNQLSSWNSVVTTPGIAAGKVINPTSFTLDNQIFYITTPGSYSFSQNQILGTNSKLVVGDGSVSKVVSVKLQGSKSEVLPRDAKGQPLPMLVDVASNGSVEFNGHDGTLPALGKLSPSSTVFFNTDRPSVTITCPTFGNLRLANNDAALVTNVTVSGTLNLSNKCLLQLSIYDLTILKGGQVVTDNEQSYVQTTAGGALRQTVAVNASTPTFFPVGQASYNPAYLSQLTGGVEDVFGVSVSDSVFASYSPIATLPAGSKAGEGHDKKGDGKPLVNAGFIGHTWFISEQDLGHSNVTMTLQGALPPTIAASSASIGHYHNNAWDMDKAPKGGKSVDPLSNSFQVTRAGITDFSPFSLNGVAPLPVELVAFGAQRTGSSVVCNWATATENDNNHFSVERSLDGQTFRALGSVAGAGTSSLQHSYRFVDAQPVSTLAYYRLHQVDNSGHDSYSPVISVAGLTASVELTAAPNPTDGQLNVTLSIPEATTIRGTLSTVLGSSVLSFEQTIGAGLQVLPLDLRTLPAGVYLLRVETPQGRQTLRVSKY
ncbi:T9SS type A sorting domain-containing protein [Hymenobacter sp. UV11]|uniref:T9SS type A sorting domain-containing protein n=1 Tax=Hymenobacter sp. UV11 TaxID=1849735 RepID=UPI001060B3BB|nr:T9SS type A sorting domain-containing protein [Hymenobacter sp. UV11]TDN36258.1 hypothetical protein A8B98_10080 [Hymenobacter sp. UV11]TFZ66966.1 T9SS type A sorting domain-containing protein [Hymenobacter sp. UV11]